jgi:hypothetical protein
MKVRPVYDSWVDAQFTWWTDELIRSMFFSYGSYGGFLTSGYPKSPWVSILSHDLMTWMIWGNPHFRNPPYNCSIHGLNNWGGSPCAWDWATGGSTEPTVGSGPQPVPRMWASGRSQKNWTAQNIMFPTCSQWNFGYLEVSVDAKGRYVHAMCQLGPPGGQMKWHAAQWCRHWSAGSRHAHVGYGIGMDRGTYDTMPILDHIGMYRFHSPKIITSPREIGTYSELAS